MVKNPLPVSCSEDAREQSERKGLLCCQNKAGLQSLI
uniref:Uncharacterized protein n=1 Tax=Anguilla anguilla TaxID=7936 RepID=A0A0E9UL20_ANGAN